MTRSFASYDVSQDCLNKNPMWCGQFTQLIWPISAAKGIQYKITEEDRPNSHHESKKSTFLPTNIRSQNIPIQTLKKNEDVCPASIMANNHGVILNKLNTTQSIQKICYKFLNNKERFISLPSQYKLIVFTLQDICYDVKNAFSD